MDIMTAGGWRSLVPPSVKAVTNSDLGLYDGPPPSIECQNFIARLKQDLLYGSPGSKTR